MLDKLFNFVMTSVIYIYDNLYSLYLPFMIISDKYEYFMSYNILLIQIYEFLGFWGLLIFILASIFTLLCFILSVTNISNKLQSSIKNKTDMKSMSDKKFLLKYIRTWNLFK